MMLKNSITLFRLTTRRLSMWDKCWQEFWMVLNSMSINANMAQLFWLVSVEFTTSKSVLLPTMVFFSVKAPKKVPTLFKFVHKEKFLWSFCKISLVLWLERNTSMKVLQSMVLKWSMLFQQQVFQRSHASSELHMELATTVCAEEPTAQECCTCGQAQKLQSWVENRLQACWLKWRKPNWKSRVNNYQKKRSKGWERRFWILMKRSQVVTIQLQGFGTMVWFCRQIQERYWDFQWW